MARILVIDDDPSLLHTVAAILSRKGHVVRQETEGRRGIAALAEFEPDVVITDINMPEMDGIEVMIGVLRVRPDMPVIAMSGGGRIDKGSLLDDAGMLGAVSTLAKPFEIEELLAAIEKAVEH